MKSRSELIIYHEREAKQLITKLINKVIDYSLTRGVFLQIFLLILIGFLKC